MIAFKTIAQMSEEIQAQYDGCPLDWPYVQESIDASRSTAYQQLGFTVLSEDAYEAYKSALQSAYNAYIGIAPSTWAVDLNNSDITVTGGSITKLIPNRVLWDVNSEFDISTGLFTPKYNGVRNLNGTIKFSTSLTTTRVRFLIYRNDEVWFTVWENTNIVGGKEYTAIFSCDCDCYSENLHNFDLRIDLDGTFPAATISGSDEETAWGMSFVAKLEGESPTG